MFSALSSPTTCVSDCDVDEGPCAMDGSNCPVVGNVNGVVVAVSIIKGPATSPDNLRILTPDCFAFKLAEFCSPFPEESPGGPGEIGGGGGRVLGGELGGGVDVTNGAIDILSRDDFGTKCKGRTSLCNGGGGGGGGGTDGGREGGSSATE